MSSQDRLTVLCDQGVKLFFKISDVLKNDVYPSEDDWRNLFNSPGYKELCEKELESDYLRDLIILAFKPSEFGKSKELIQKYYINSKYSPKYSESILKSFKDADLCRSEIQDFLQLMSNSTYVKKIDTYINEFLENFTMDSTVRINFIVFNDSRGYDPIIIGLSSIIKLQTNDCLNLMNKNENEYLPLTLLIAHEVYHNIRDKRINYNHGAYEGEDKILLKILNDINNEGIADLINVRRLYDTNGYLVESDLAKLIQKEQCYQYATIEVLDYLITEMSKHDSLKTDLSMIAKSIITRSGHPLGYFMAKIILSQLGVSELKKVATNPFGFVISYNKAAKKMQNIPIFSDNSIDYIKILEKKYLKL